ncbi:unnamed protein product [Kluyveromyces dobzhanskii CBS 2104]|uniref:WGS project CCBQ000000000 data, contig 00006 n=1 Tax=Kluyveromyces dobzhanskii CBS 2104 TaxID=1427455 RepID=A0A0A8LA50_9SACH|nr:unnamed protein product [Kluyveromyces dobzhanskii CBS 2104]
MASSASIDQGGTGKNIILCFDGTDNTFGPNPFSNVLKVYRMLDNSDYRKQICYYQPGIGTSLEYDSQTGISGFLNWSKLKMAVDSCIAYSLDHHIVTAYMYLMHHYEPGDKIVMFGFSRGAFTARVLAGMLEMVGLLNVGLDEMIWMAWKIYEAWEYAAQPVHPSYATTLVEEFKKTFSRNIDIQIHFQGLFDSVNSCGILLDRLFPFTARSGIVRHIRHAVSVDERRGKMKQQSFSPNPYRPNLFSLNYRNYIVEYENIAPKLKANYESTNNQFINHTITSRPDSSQSNKSMQELITRINTFLENEHSRRSDNFVNQRVEGIFEVNSPHGTFDSNRTSSDLIEKWFPGDHSDVGGSWPPDITENNHFLSDIPLRWILSEAIEFGVNFKKGIIHEFANKYTSAGSLLSASHDLLSFGRSNLTMKNPFHKRKTGEYDKDKINNYHGFKKMRAEGLFSWRPKAENVYFRTFDFRTASSASSSVTGRISDSDPELNHGIEHITARQKKHDGSGNVSVFRVMFWWIAELIPIGIRLENEKCEWKNVYVPNLGRRRNIPEYGELHWSVFWRVKLVQDYRPKNLPDYCVDLIDEHENLEQLMPPDSVNDGCNCEKRNIEKLKKDTSEILTQWEREGWEAIPDDLEELLKSNPEL